MKKFGLAGVALVIGLSQGAWAVPIGGVEFPDGAVSFADSVVSYVPGANDVSYARRATAKLGC